MSGANQEERPVIRATRRWISFWRLVGAVAWFLLMVAFFFEPLRDSSGPLQDRLPDLRKRSFMLSVVSRPGGGRITVSGVDRGKSPVLVNVECDEGQPVIVNVELPGYSSFREEVPCQEGGNYDVEARMTR